MATTHGSFDGSRLGAFTRSRLGVRNSGPATVLIWLDWDPSFSYSRLVRFYAEAGFRVFSNNWAYPPAREYLVGDFDGDAAQYDRIVIETDFVSFGETRPPADWWMQQIGSWSGRVYLVGSAGFNGAEWTWMNRWLVDLGGQMRGVGEREVPSDPRVIPHDPTHYLNNGMLVGYPGYDSFQIYEGGRSLVVGGNWMNEELIHTATRHTSIVADGFGFIKQSLAVPFARPGLEQAAADFRQFLRNVVLLPVDDV